MMLCVHLLDFILRQVDRDRRIVADRLPSNDLDTAKRIAEHCDSDDIHRNQEFVKCKTGLTLRREPVRSHD
jgi:hypothetical protein